MTGIQTSLVERQLPHGGPRLRLEERQPLEAPRPVRLVHVEVRGPWSQGLPELELAVGGAVRWVRALVQGVAE